MEQDSLEQEVTGVRFHLISRSPSLPISPCVDNLPNFAGHEDTTKLLLNVFSAKHYRYNPPRGSAFTRMAQVIVASVRKRNLTLPDDPSKLYLNSRNEDAVPAGRANLSVDEGDEVTTLSGIDDFDEKYTIDCRGPAGEGQPTELIVATSPAEKLNASEAAYPEKWVKEEKTAGVSSDPEQTTLASNVQKNIKGSKIVEMTEESFDLRKCKDVKVTDEGPHLETWEAMAERPHHDGGEEDEYHHVLLRHSDQFR